MRRQTKDATPPLPLRCWRAVGQSRRRRAAVSRLPRASWRMQRTLFAAAERDLLVASIKLQRSKAAAGEHEPRNLSLRARGRARLDLDAARQRPFLLRRTRSGGP